MTEIIRTQILDSAETRFRTYGYGKTTMAEIATDINMSTANLYRYFENKLDIGSAMAQRCFVERNNLLNSIVERQGLPVNEKLETFVLELLNYMHEQFSSQPKISELVDIIVNKRPDLVQKKVENDKKLIAIMLEQGNVSGEFSIKNVDEMSAYVLSAIAKFSTPFFLTLRWDIWS